MCQERKYSQSHNHSGLMFPTCNRVGDKIISTWICRFRDERKNGKPYLDQTYLGRLLNFNISSQLLIGLDSRFNNAKLCNTVVGSQILLIRLKQAWRVSSCSHMAAHFKICRKSKNNKSCFSLEANTFTSTINNVLILWIMNKPRVSQKLNVSVNWKGISILSHEMMVSVIRVLTIGRVE